ncbi:MAG: hypothetical protein RMY27_26775 [Nostoc sp. DedQUE09]|nr:hypothetical protein [Nostoc sp. DedQUE09]MDZ7954637.1 hypothetical protein [Nostoc sp. DedQUE09]
MEKRGSIQVKGKRQMMTCILNKIN